MPQKEAEIIYAKYKKYLDCEIELAKKISEFGQPKTLMRSLTGLKFRISGVRCLEKKWLTDCTEQK